jgi:hypothetical protein
MITSILDSAIQVHHSPSWKANEYSVSQEIPRIL